MENLVNIDFKSKNVLVRSEAAGVFCGILEHHEDDYVILSDCRRIWYWDGAASCSELAMKGVTNPDNCKFPIKVKLIKILKVIEIIPMTDEAVKSIDGVKIWGAHEE